MCTFRDTVTCLWRQGGIWIIYPVTYLYHMYSDHIVIVQCPYQVVDFIYNDRCACLNQRCTTICLKSEIHSIDKPFFSATGSVAFLVHSISCRAFILCFFFLNRCYDLTAIFYTVNKTTCTSFREIIHSLK